MDPLPVPLAIMIWLVGGAWVVALMAYILDAPVELVWLIVFLGTGTGLVEWVRLGHKRNVVKLDFHPFLTRESAPELPPRFVL